MSGELEKPAIEVRVQLALAVRGSLAPIEYKLGGVSIRPSYPKIFPFLGMQQPFPYQLATVFDINWNEPSRLMLSESIRLRREPLWHPILHESLDRVNQLLSAYKYACLNHILGTHVRTVGEADLIYYLAELNGQQVALRSSGVFGLFFHHGQHTAPGITNENPDGTVGAKWREADIDVTDFDHGTIFRAGKYLFSGVPPIGGRIVRCLELAEHGYYSESVIIAHATLDDLVQRMLRDRLVAQGLGESDAKGLIRSIKEDRWAKYLGPLLKTLSGKSLNDVWPQGMRAVAQVNKWRNDLAHAGSQADSRQAHLCAFFVAKCISELHRASLITDDVEPEVLKYVELLASRVENPPDWVPRQ
jgi:hypothetical protein